MKRLIWAGIFLSCSTFVHAWNPPDGEKTITSDTRTVSVSTAIASPTLLLTTDSYIQRSLLINFSSCTVILSTSTSNLSFSTSFTIPGSSTGTANFFQFSPDGVNSPYWGPLYGVSSCGAASSSLMSVFRSK